MKKTVTLLAILALFLNFTKAQTLTNQDINFSGLLTANGWTGHSGTGTNAINTTGGLTYPGILGSGIGNAALVNNLSGEDVNVTFTNQNTDGQNIYVSFLVNVPEAAAKTGDYVLNIGGGSTGASFTLFAGRFFVRTPSAGVVNFGMSNTATATYSATSFATNTTYLVIIKYTISVAGNDPVSMWVKSAGVPATEAAAGTADIVNTTTAGQNAINAVALRQGSATTSAQTIIDAIKVGLTWADVTPSSTVPLLSPSASTMTFTSTAVGVASPSQLFNLSGNNLTPASGNITITPSTHYEISFDNTNFFTTAQTVAYSGGTLGATPVYVRLASSAPAGVTNGTITCSGGGAPNAVINLAGGVSQNYYNTKANLGLTNVGTWSTTLDGTGPSPANFTSGFQIFNIISQANANYTGVWDVNFSGSKVVVGDGTNPVTFTILPGIDSVTSGTRVDVLNNGTLVMQNNRRPFLNSLATGSTVDFAQIGVTTADTIRIPTLSYFNLKFTGGLKYFSSGTTTIRGDFTADAVVSMNGAGTPFSTVNSLGNVTIQNGAAFESIPTGDNGRITWKMNGPGPTQNISGTGLNFLFFRLQRDSAAVNSINVAPNTNITLGNAAGGGLSLTPVGATLNYGTGTLSFIGNSTSTNTALGRITANGTSMTFAKTAGTTANMGTIKFNTGSVLNDITMNVDAAIARDTITFANDVSMTGVLTLTKGKIVVAPGATLSLTSTATTTGSSTGLSFVDGLLRRTGTTAFTYPVGKGNKYAPVEFSAYTGGDTYTVQYFNTGYPGGFTVDPATLATYPTYDLSRFEYWNITQAAAGTVDLTFYYTDANSYIFTPNAIRMAHFDGTDWDDIGGTPNPFNFPTSGSVKVTGVSQFSPFTFSALNTGVIPVNISSFTVQKSGSTVQLNWVTEQEISTKEFVVEKSLDGRNWTTVTTLAAAGFSSVKRYYSAVDFTPASGVNFYRLKSVDVHGGFEYSEVKSLYFGKTFNVITSPNPVRNILMVYLPEPVKSEVRLFNSYGQLVKSVSASEQTVPVNVNGLARGIYILSVTGNGIYDTRKVFID